MPSHEGQKSSLYSGVTSNKRSCVSEVQTHDSVQDGKKDNNPNSDWEHKLQKYATYIHIKDLIKIKPEWMDGDI